MTDHDAANIPLGNTSPDETFSDDSFSMNSPPDNLPPVSHVHEDDDVIISEKDLEVRISHLAKLFKDHQAVDNGTFPNAIAGFLAFILLVIWASTTIVLISADIQAEPLSATETAPTSELLSPSSLSQTVETQDINNGLIQVNTTIGGLVSALIVSVLSIADPKTNPLQRFSILERTSTKKMRLRLQIKRWVRLLQAEYDRAHPNGQSDHVETIDEWARYLTLRSLIDKEVLTKKDKEELNGDIAASDNLLSHSPGCLERISQGFTSLLVFSYLMTWLLLGALALVFGVILTPDSNETVFTIGSTWLGTAVMAGYAYFNLNTGADTDDEQM